MSHRVRNGHINVSSVYSIPEEKEEAQEMCMSNKNGEYDYISVQTNIPFSGIIPSGSLLTIHG